MNLFFLINTPVVLDMSSMPSVNDVLGQPDQPGAPDLPNMSSMPSVNDALDQPGAPDMPDQLGASDLHNAPDMFAWRLHEIEHMPNIWCTNLINSAKLDALFNDLGKPTYAVKVGILYAKYEIAKKLQIQPHIMRVLLVIYAVSMLIAVSYATVKIQEQINAIFMQCVIYLNFSIAVVNYVRVIFGYTYNVGAAYLTSTSAGFVLIILSDSIGWVIYCLSHVQIITALCRRWLNWLLL